MDKPARWEFVVIREDVALKPFSLGLLVESKEILNLGIKSGMIKENDLVASIDLMFRVTKPPQELILTEVQPRD